MALHTKSTHIPDLHPPLQGIADAFIHLCNKHLTMPAAQTQYASDSASQQAAEMSVVLCTAGCKLRSDCQLTTDDHTIRFWEAWSGICYRQIPLQPAWVCCVMGLADIQKQVNRLAISPDKNYLAAAGSGTVRYVDRRTS